jgi:hypothetical protein
MEFLLRPGDARFRLLTLGGVMITEKIAFLIPTAALILLFVVPVVKSQAVPRGYSVDSKHLLGPGPVSQTVTASGGLVTLHEEWSGTQPGTEISQFRLKDIYRVETEWRGDVGAVDLWCNPKCGGDHNYEEIYTPSIATMNSVAEQYRLLLGQSSAHNTKAANITVVTEEGFGGAKVLVAINAGDAAGFVSLQTYNCANAFPCPGTYGPFRIAAQGQNVVATIVTSAGSEDNSSPSFEYNWWTRNSP